MKIKLSKLVPGRSSKKAKSIDEGVPKQIAFGPLTPTTEGSGSDPASPAGQLFPDLLALPGLDGGDICGNPIDLVDSTEDHEVKTDDFPDLFGEEEQHDLQADEVPRLRLASPHIAWRREEEIIKDEFGRPHSMVSTKDDSIEVNKFDTTTKDVCVSAVDAQKGKPKKKKKKKKSTSQKTGEKTGEKTGDKKKKKKGSGKKKGSKKKKFNLVKPDSDLVKRAILKMQEEDNARALDRKIEEDMLEMDRQILAQMKKEDSANKQEIKDRAIMRIERPDRERSEDQAIEKKYWKKVRSWAPKRNTTSVIMYSYVARNGTILADSYERGQTDRAKNGLYSIAEEFAQKTRCRGFNEYTIPVLMAARADVTWGISCVQLMLVDKNIEGRRIWWTMGCIYDPRGSLEYASDVQSFLEKLAEITQIFRESEYDWQYAGYDKVQLLFGDVLDERMQEINIVSKMKGLLEI